ncbi:MAG: glycosyltransferase family 39 protein [Euryarchaeota archaeon]|nr:glycosyltransferase family 39 protein [Euryarchaeota archaeon]
MKNLDLRDEPDVLLFIFGISIILRLFYVIIFQTMIFSDASAYNTMAIGLISGNGYGGGISSYWPPGQPFFLAAIYTVFGYSPQMACIFQAVISSLTCIVIYYIGKMVFGRKVGAISGLIAALYPTFIIFCGDLRSETLFIFLSGLSVLFLLRTLDDFSARSISIAGVSFGLAMLVRPAIMGLAPLVCIWIVLSSKDRKKNLMRSITFCIVLMAVISPWMIRNYNVHHQFVLVSTNGGVNLWLGNNADATGMACNYLKNETMLWTIWNTSDDEVEREKLFYEKGFLFIRENPIDVLRLDIKKFSYLWGFPLHFFGMHLNDMFINPIPKWLFIVLAPLTILPYIALLPLAIIGVVFYQNWNKSTYLLILIIFYYTLIHSVILAETRYHLQIIPYLIVFAAYGICKLNNVRSEFRLGDPATKRKMNIFFLSIMVLIVIWCHSTCYWFGRIIIFIKDFAGG